MSPWLAAFGLLLLIPGALGFAILPGESLNHLEITERAILNATVQACRELAKAERADFTFPVRIPSAEVGFLEMISYIM